MTNQQSVGNCSCLRFGRPQINDAQRRRLNKNNPTTDWRRNASKSEWTHQPSSQPSQFPRPPFTLLPRQYGRSSGRANGDTPLSRRYVSRRLRGCHVLYRDSILHRFEHGSLQWERHLSFRDRLLASPELAARYSQIKLAAAEQADVDRNALPIIEIVFHQGISGSVERLLKSVSSSFTLAPIKSRTAWN